MGDPANRQEQVLREFASNAFGGRQVFHPDLYRIPPKEAADLAIVTGRLAILVYMKDSRLTFEKLTRRNLAQARTWLLRWQKGERLRGRNSHREFDIGWNDVDDVVVLSVLDGPEAACLAHTTALLDTPKVAFAASITGQCLLELARLDGGARDLLTFLDGIGADGSKVEQAAAIEMLTAMHEVAFSELAAWLALRGRREAPGDHAASYMQAIGRHLKQHDSEVADLNLDWRDMVLIAGAATEMLDKLAAPHTYGHVVAASLFPKKGFGVVAATDIKALADRPKTLELLTANRLSAVFYFVVFHGELTGMVFYSENPRQSDAIEIAALRSYRQRILN